MAKDPAVLWYFNDWAGGTLTLSRHQKGCYMDVLNAQFNSGPLSLEEIKTVLGNDFAAWGVISKKFKYDEKSGLFFNERLESERLKRKAFVESRRNNLKSKPPHMGPHMEPHMDAHTARRMENRNRNEDVIKIREGDARGRVDGDIVAGLFNRICCPPLVQLSALNNHRKVILLSRLELYPEIDFWESFFKRVAASDFLCGRAPPGPGRDRAFKATFEWLVDSRNFDKVVEGRYDNEEKESEPSRTLAHAF